MHRDLYAALGMLRTELRRYGINTPSCSLKEKFGTIRNYDEPRGVTNLHDVFWPGYVFCQWSCTCGKQQREAEYRATWANTEEWRSGLRELQRRPHRRWCVQGQLWHLDVYVWPKLFRRTGVTWLTRKIQEQGYRHAYTRVLQRFPHLEYELMSGSSHRLCGDMVDFGQWWQRWENDKVVPCTTPQTAGWRAWLSNEPGLLRKTDETGTKRQSCREGVPDD